MFFLTEHLLSQTLWNNHSLSNLYIKTGVCINKWSTSSLYLIKTIKWSEVCVSHFSVWSCFYSTPSVLGRYCCLSLDAEFWRSKNLFLDECWTSSSNCEEKKIIQKTKQKKTNHNKKKKLLATLQMKWNELPNPLGHIVVVIRLSLSVLDCRFVWRTWIMMWF